jgi:hypothetical protein
MLNSIHVLKERVSNNQFGYKKIKIIFIDGEINDLNSTMYLHAAKNILRFMYRYPNRMLLRVTQRLQAIWFDSIYCFYSYLNVTENARQILNVSMEKYLQ